jgi:hypothetical protein
MGEDETVSASHRTGTIELAMTVGVGSAKWLVADAPAATVRVARVPGDRMTG